ncbi:hypothetical protein CN481_00200 [Bacillus sp. AFS006103]|nr:hypothetical protein CN481_00200 [Bacillus sp. AFS006103]
MDYRFVVREYELLQVVGDQAYPQECIGIAIHDPWKDIDYPSPITNFIKSKYRRKSSSLSNQSNPANYICRFLNYCRDKANNDDYEFNELRINGLFGLKRKHASIYISDLSILARAGKLAPQYVRSIIRCLNKFYEWLNDEKILQEKVKFTYKERRRRIGNELVKEIILQDIFDDVELGTIYPPYRNKKVSKLVDFGKYRYELVEMFLDIAERIEPEIYLGCCFQFFGGLRKGEVVNLTRKSLIKLDDGYMLNVVDNRSVLFPNKKNTIGEQVKVPREQALFWNTHLAFALDKQLKLLEMMRKNGNLPIPEALFINKRTGGNPLTGKAYWEKYNHVKEELISKLSKEGKSKQFNFVTSKRWSTHLSRGVFTNFCLDMGMSISETAIARGDSNISSVMDYVETLSAYETMNDAMNNIRKAFDNKSGKMKSVIPESALGKWKKQEEK